MPSSECLKQATLLEMMDAEQGGTKLLRNVGSYIPVDTPQYRRRFYSSAAAVVYVFFVY